MGSQFAHAWQQVLAVDRNARGADLLLQEGFNLLDHDQMLDLCRQGADQAQGGRIAEAQLDQGRVGKGFQDVQIGGSRGDKADPQVLAGLEPVQIGDLREGAELLLAGQHEGDAATSIHGRHDHAGRIFLEALDQALLPLARYHHPLDMADTGREAQEHRGVELLREGEGLPSHLIGLLGVGGLQDGEVGEAAPVAGVLLILGGGQAYVVRHGHHQTTTDPNEGLGHESVRGHVQTDVFHGAEGAASRQGGADRHLQRNLLVDRPLRVEVFIGGGVFEDFRGGRAGVGRRHPAARFPGTARDGLVTRHKAAFGLG